MSQNVIIIGGGISGLSAAWFLHRRGFSVRVLEENDRVGGVIGTEIREGWRSETGPNSILWKEGREEDAFGRLVDQLGLSSRRIDAGTAGSRRYVLRGGRLRALPAGPGQFVTNQLFSWRAKLRLLAEPWIGRGVGEETIAAFVTRRLGREFLDYAVEPFVSGVYAGDPSRLSVQAAVPRIHALEVHHGSLIRGAIAMGKVTKASGLPRGRLVSFDEGMGVLPASLGAALPPGSLQVGARVVGLEPAGDGGWRVLWREAGGEVRAETAPRVVLAVPAAAAAELIAVHVPRAAEILRGIPYAPIVSAAMGWRRGGVGHPLDGFGFLVPRREGMRLLGGLFSSSLFPGRAPEGRVLITAFIGGATDPQVVTQDEAVLSQTIRDDLARALAVDGLPEMTRITRWSRAIPQYTLGHLERVAEVERLTAALPGLSLLGSWRGGVAVADCILSGEKLAESMSP
ncbi:MAG: protoporphyrinogen oxidase [Alphaproteobacteria bacterium]